MTYRHRVIALSALVGILGMTYAATLIFDPERAASRNAAYAWIEPKWVEQADRIRITGPGSGAEETTLVFREGRWKVLRANREYPARQERVRDLLQVLSARAAYPVRASSDAAHGKLGVTEGTASRIILSGGASIHPLLDLLIGSGDLTGQEVYLRKNGKKEVRSGQDRFTLYTDSAPAAWCDLRLFADDSGNIPAAGDVQRVRITPPPMQDERDPSVYLEVPGRSYILSRDAGGGWISPGPEAVSPDRQRVESWLRQVLDVPGEDFIPTAAADPAAFTGGRLDMEFGNGTVRTILVGPPGDGPLDREQRPVMVQGKPLVYALAEWNIKRIFRERGYFGGR